MNAKYIYTARGFVQPQMEEPTRENNSIDIKSFVQYTAERTAWEKSLSSLPAIPVQGTHGFEVGKWYELDKDFFIAKTDLKIYGTPLPPQPAQDKAGIDNGQKYDILPDGTLTPAYAGDDNDDFKYPSYEQAGGNKSWSEMSELERANYDLCKTLNALAVSRTTIKRLREKLESLKPPTPAERTFTLQDMIDAISKGRLIGMTTGNDDPAYEYERQQYFKTKFNTEL